MMRAPVRVRDLKRARGEPRLIGERMLGSEHVLLEAGVHFRRIGQHAFEQRRRDREDLQARAAHDRDGAVQLLIGQIDDVLAEHHTEFGARHTEFESWSGQRFRYPEKTRR